MTVKIQTPKPEVRCPYCQRDTGSKFTLKAHKRVCRNNPANRMEYR